MNRPSVMALHYKYMLLISDQIIVDIINAKRTEINEVDFIVFILISFLVLPLKLNMHCK
jgi:hypothetical protein